MKPSEPTLAGAPFGPSRAVFGEGAFWSVRDQCVWWVDMVGRGLFRTDMAGMTRRFQLPESPSGVADREGGGLVVAMGARVVGFDPVSQAIEDLWVPDTLPQGHRLNDTTVDPAGRFLVGSMYPANADDRRGRLYVVERGRPARDIAEGFSRTNGLAFAPDGRTLYVSDSAPDVRTVWTMTYDPDTGSAGPPTVHADHATAIGNPDGGAVDRDGRYWSAAHHGGRLNAFGHDGALAAAILLPVSHPTKPAFGGPDLRTLFVTSAGTRTGEADDGLQGHLIALPSPVAGLSLPEVRL